MLHQRVFGAIKMCAGCNRLFRVERATARSSTAWKTYVVDPVTREVIDVRFEVEVHLYCQSCCPTAV